MKVKLKDITSLITKGTTPTTLGFCFQSQGIKFVKVESFEADGTFIPSKTSYISEDCNEALKRSQLKENDILFSIAGAIGRVAVVTKEMLPCNTNQALAIIRIRDGCAYLPYIKLVLSSSCVSKQFNKLKQGVAQLNLSLTDVGNLEIPLPDYAEQESVSRNLERLQTCISARRAQLAKLDELVKCRFVEMFNCKMQADCNKILGDYAEVTGGFAFKSEKFEAEGVPIIRIGNIINNRVNLDEVVCYPEDFWEENSAYRVNCGDILMAMSGATTGKIGFCNSNSKLLLNQRVARIRTKPLFNYTAFLRAALEQDWMAEHILKTAYGCAQPNISAAEIRQLPMPDTTIESVQCFTSFIQRIDKLRFIIQKSLDETQKLFDSLMQEYFG